MAYKDYPFYHGANAFTFEKARTLKADSTLAEQTLWKKLKAKKFHGLKFRRQHPLSKFIVDFYCNELKLVIELDGGIHLVEEIHTRDVEREKIILRFGVTILRFTNEEVLEDVYSVLNKLEIFYKHKSSLSNMERE